MSRILTRCLLAPLLLILTTATSFAQARPIEVPRLSPPPTPPPISSTGPPPIAPGVPPPPGVPEFEIPTPLCDAKKIHYEDIYVPDSSSPTGLRKERVLACDP